MAILITDNEFIDRPPLNITMFGASMQNPERLLTPRLQPAMTYGMGGDITFQIILQQTVALQDIAIALLGATADGGPIEVVSMSVRSDSGGGFSTEPFTDHVLQAPGKSWHTVIVPTSSSSNARDGIRLWFAAPLQGGRIGALYLGTRHEAYALADAGWSIRYPDQRQRTTSYGGQVYSASDDPLIAREVSIPAAYSSTTQNGIHGMGSVPDIAGIYHRHGHTRPIIAMTHSHDDDMNSVTGLYGTMEGGSAISHTSGPLFGSALRLRETL